MATSKNNSLERLLCETIITNNIKGVTGVILAAGFGKRMGDLTQNIPKPLLPVLNCPLVGWSIAQMKAYGIQNVTMNVHYLSEMFNSLIPVAAKAKIKLNLVKETKLSGPFGGVLSCCSFIPKGNDVLVFTGDSYFEVDINRLILSHRQHNADLTLGVATVSDGSNYGVVDIDNNGIVQSMREKPSNIGPVDTASCGVYVVSYRLISRMIGEALPLDWIDVINQLIVEKQAIASDRVDIWFDAGTPPGLLDLNRKLLGANNLSRIAKIENQTQDAFVWTQGKHSEMGNATFSGTVLIGNAVSVGYGSTINSSVIGDDSQIGSNVNISNSLIFPGSVIPDNVNIINQIVTSI